MDVNTRNNVDLILLFLIAVSVVIVQSYNTALMICSQYGHEGCTKMLLEYKADIEQVSLVLSIDLLAEYPFQLLSYTV